MPLQIIAGLGAYASVLGIYSFFDDAINGGNGDRAILAELDNIDGQLSNLQALSNAQINQSIAQSLAASRTALDTLERYAVEESAGTRDALAASAIQSATESLNEVVAQVRAVKDAASLESLAYAFGAIHYAMLARQFVANTVESGPLGSAGLHRQIKEAAALLYDETNRPQDLLWQIEGRIADNISVSYELVFDPVGSLGVSNQAVWEITTTSRTTDDSDFFRLYMRGEVVGQLFVATETLEEFQARATSQGNARFNQMLDGDLEEIGRGTLVEIGNV